MTAVYLAPTPSRWRRILARALRRKRLPRGWTEVGYTTDEPDTYARPVLPVLSQMARCRECGEWLQFVDGYAWVHYAHGYARCAGWKD